MDRDRIIALLLAAVLLGACFVGCSKKPTEAIVTPGPTVEAATEVPASEGPFAVPVRMNNGGDLSFLTEAALSVPKLSEMTYARPDTEKLISEIETLIDSAPGYDSADGLLRAYYEIAIRLHNYETMYQLSYYRFCLDPDDDHYADEYGFCDEQYVIVEEKKGALYAALAASPFRNELEQACFGEGFFAEYDGFSEADEQYFALKQRENELLFEYYELSANNDPETDAEIQWWHETVGGIFIELVKVRQQIAAAKGFDNYMDYIYASEYKRDYTTEQAREFLDQVRAQLVPLMQDSRIANEFSVYSMTDESMSMEFLSSAAENMGDPVWEAFRFMSGHELYDIESSPKKMDIGYTSYLPDYEAPFIFIDPDSKALTSTLFHEFGHFADAYCGYGFSDSYEISETYSQAMQYLAYDYADGFTDSQRARNLRATLSDLLVYSVLRQGAFGDFELRAYSLEPEELTIDKLDAVYEQCIRDYGLFDYGGFDFKSIYWCFYGHFFGYPGYVISYSVSAVASLQICRMETEEPGAGVEAFRRLLGRSRGVRFSAFLNEAGLDSPFDADTMTKTAAFLKKAFGLD